MKTRLFLLGICLFLLSSVDAQTTIKGTVVDSLNGNKLFYVSVGVVTPDSLMRVVGVAFTEADGSFSISDVPAGKYLLRTSLVGYDMLSVPLNVPSGQSVLDLGTVGMKKSSTALEEVTVSAVKPVYMMEGEKTLYNVSEDPSVQTGTASDALQNAPGVEVDIEGNITLRGVSSVEIWINDKPSHLSAEGLKTFIQQLPANSLERIEVITNPSARYSAKGTGGIINIVTTSKITKNSFVSFGVYGSSQPQVWPWVSYVWSNEKLSINFYAGLGYHFDKRSVLSTGTRFDEQMDTSSTVLNTLFSKNNSFNGSMHFSLDYEIDSMNSISYWLGGHPSWGNNSSFEVTNRKEYIYNPNTYQYFTDEPSSWWNAGGYTGLYYNHKFNDEGHEISADIGGGSWNRVSQSDFNRYFLNETGLNRKKNSYDKNYSYSFDGSLDYVLPYHEDGELSLGLWGVYDKDWGTVRSDTLIYGTEDEYTLDSLRFKDFKSNSYELEAYATVEHSFGNFTIKGGLRGEYIYEDYQILNSPSDNVGKGYFGLFPSLHLSYRTKSMHNFKLSYTRRVSNPDAQQLSTFITYNEDSYSIGNPALKQTFTNSVEAGWTKFFQKFGSVGITAYFKNSTNQISNLSDVAYCDVFQRIVSFSQPVNAGKSFNTGAELNVTYRLKTFMNIRFYGNLYYSQSEFIFRNQEDPTKVKNLAYSFRLNFWAKLWKVLEVNASAYYNSKTVTLFSVVQPRYGINCGLRADFLDRKISVHLNVNDIFNWNARTTESTNPYYIYSTTARNKSRSISLGLTFRFGKMELEGKARQGGSGGGNMGE